jgi:diguanylate cyclase (GGDEF)-like protein
MPEHLGRGPNECHRNSGPDRSKMPSNAAKPTEERTKKRPAKRGLGLAGRVALIAIGAAIVATLAQWVATPILARGEVERQHAIAVTSGANLLAGITAVAAKAGNWDDIDELIVTLPKALPEGQATVFDASWALAARSGSADPLPSAIVLQDLLKDPKGFLTVGDRVFAVRTIGEPQRALGYVVYSFKPRSALTMWLSIVALNAVVLVVALAVLGPFLAPIARHAMKPVSELERAIRKRDARDKSRLADSSDDRVLKPLLAAVDEVHERSEAAMRRALSMAYTDPVTRLPNRLRFVSKLESAVATEPSLYLVICDLDRFRHVNVSFGPRIADMALATVAERLRASASRTAPNAFFIGRIGADQFGILLSVAAKCTVSEFLMTAERAISESVLLDDQQVRITASFGVAHAPQDGAAGSDLLKQAEVALKEAKGLSGVRHAFFDQSLLAKARSKSKLEEEVREGLDRGEFVAVFQPKVRLETGELVGAEALARWRRPDGAIVPPGVFVPIAEELGLISQLGKSVMRDACFAAAGWNANGNKSSIAVNVSPHQFDDPEFISSVYQALDDSCLPPELLELEITESAAVADPDRVARIMWPLRNRGVRLAIDDFGTGHSNFASITRLPFDVFKIDQQFIRALSTDPHAPAIVEMILAMAEALGQETVAEGVETKEQADFLLRRACTIGQGYYYSPPLPAAEFDQFVRSWRPRPADRFAA